MLTATQTSKNGRVPYEVTNKLLKQSAKKPWINRNVINFAHRKFCERTKRNLQQKIETSMDTKKTVGHCPKGSTNIFRRDT